MAIALPGVGRLPHGPIRDLAVALHELYNDAGQPAGRDISKPTYRDRELESVSHETVSSLLRGATVPAWPKVRSIVIVLHRKSIRPAPELDVVVLRILELWKAARSPAEPPRKPSSAAPAPTIESPESSAPVGGAAVPPPAAPSEQGERANGALLGALPERLETFTGREPLLDGMRRHHVESPNSRLVLFGVGGVGKTQLAVEYAHRHAAAYDVVWWIPADEPERARAAMVALAGRLGISPRQGTELAIALALDQLEQPGANYLLIFDGVEDHEIADLMPTIGGHLLITCRDPSWAHDSAHVPVEVTDFDEAETTQFLRRFDPELSATDVTMVTDVVGRLPLALDQVATFRAATAVDWHSLVTQLDGLGALPGAEARIAAFLRLAREQLAQASPAAAMLFELFAWFGSEPVTVPLLQQGKRGDLPLSLARTLRDPIALRKAIVAIVRYGLARLQVADQRIEVQPSTRAALRAALSPDQSGRVRQYVQEILAAADPGWPDGLATLEMHRTLAPHVLPAGLIESSSPAAQRCVCNQIRYRYVTRGYENARVLGEAAVSRWQQPDVLGPGHELVLLATREWANALRALGHYAEAQTLTADAMDLLRADPRYGDDHPITLEMAISHAADLRIAGRYRTALRTDEATTRQLTTAFGATDERAMRSRHNMAVSLRLLGEFARAEEIDQAEVERFEAAGAAGPDRRRLLAVNALTEDLYGLGRYRKALDLARPLLAEGSALQASDAAILLARRNVALALLRLDEVSDAVAMLRETYETCVTSFGADHEYTLVSAMSLANALRRSTQLGEAYALALDAVDTYQRSFGRRNPLTLAAEVNFASILRARGDRDDALRADDVAVRVLSETIGDEHPFTITAMIGLATDRAHSGEGGALAVSERAYRAAREVHGARHTHTLIAGANLVLDRTAAGARDSDPLHEAVLAELRRGLDADHPLIRDVAAGIRIECDIEPPSA